MRYFEPKVNEKFYFVTTTKTIMHGKWNNSFCDKLRLYGKNVFQCKQDAKECLLITECSGVKNNYNLPLWYYFVSFNNSICRKEFDGGFFDIQKLYSGNFFENIVDAEKLLLKLN